MNNKLITPPLVRYLEVLGLGKQYIGNDGLNGHIPDGHFFIGYRIGSKIKKKIMTDLKLFVKQCYPGERYIKRKAKQILTHSAFEKEILIVTDFKNPFVIDVITATYSRSSKNYAKAAD